MAKNSQASAGKRWIEWHEKDDGYNATSQNNIVLGIQFGWFFFFSLKSLFPIYAFRHSMKLLYIVTIMDYRKCIVYNFVSSS